MFPVDLQLPLAVTVTDLKLQSNLSRVDMQYSGHLVIGDTFWGNRPNHDQTLIKKLLYSGYFYSGQLYSGHNFLVPHK